MNLFSTIPKRRKMAAIVSATITEIFGSPVELGKSELHSGEFDYRREWFETDRGQVSHFHIAVRKYGVSIHIKFKSPLSKPRTFGTASATKWNHYIWQRDVVCADDYLEYLNRELLRILPEIIPNGKTRQGLPDKSALWAQYIAELEANKQGEVA